MKLWFGKKNLTIEEAADAAVQDVLDAVNMEGKQPVSPSVPAAPAASPGVPGIGVPRVAGLGIPVVGTSAPIRPAENFGANTTTIFKNENAPAPQPASSPVSVTQSQVSAVPVSFPHVPQPTQETPRSPTVRLKPLSSIPVPSASAMKLQPKESSPIAPATVLRTVPVVPVTGTSAPSAQPPAAFTLKPRVAAPAQPDPVAAKPVPLQAAPVSASAVQFRLHPRTPVAALPEKSPVAPPPAPPTATPAAPSPATENNGIVRPRAEQKALYYQLMNGLYDAVLILDEHGHVVDGNVRCEDVLGYQREDLWDLPVDKIITGLTTMMLGNLRRNIAEHHHILMDARCFRRDGSSFSGEVGISGISLTRGGNNLVFAIRNIERRKAAMNELRRSQAALQVSLAPTFVCNQEGYFQQINPAFLQAFGIPDEAQAKKIRFMDILPDAARCFLRASCGEKVQEKLQISVDGTLVLLTISLTPIKSGTEITGVAGSIMQ